MSVWCAVAALLCMLPLAASASDPERDRIAAERAAAKARFARQVQACGEQFIVASCVEAAGKEQREVLTRLRRQELQLDDMKRRETAAARARSNASKAEAHVGRASDPATAPRREGTRPTPQPNPPALLRSGTAGAARNSPAEEQRNEARFESRARAAQARREKVERRNAERAAQGKVAKPLPVPDGASAPR